MGSEFEKYPGYSLEENLKKALTELLVLYLLSEQECYIGELTAAIRQRSSEALTIVFPYSAVYRLERDGLIIETQKRTAPDGRRRQYLGITEAGRKRLTAMLDVYIRFMNGVEDVLRRREEKI